jgi:hypothetical protein
MRWGFEDLQRELGYFRNRYLRQPRCGTTAPKMHRAKLSRFVTSDDAVVAHRAGRKTLVPLSS